MIPDDPALQDWIICPECGGDGCALCNYGGEVETHSSAYRDYCYDTYANYERN